MARSRTRHVLAGGPFIGPDAITADLFAKIPTTFGTTWKVRVDRLLATGNTVIMEGRYHGTAQATGTPLAPQVAHIWDLTDGRITRFQQYTETWLFAHATGTPPVTPN